MGLKHIEDDVMSRCGSIAGETITWQRRRTTCSLRKHSNISNLVVCNPNKTTDETSKDQETGRRFNTSFHYYRFVIIMLAGISIGCMLLIRYNITVAIIYMVNQTALYMDEHPNKTVQDFLDEGYELGGDFDWSNEIQQMIMSLYMFTYALPQMPCTRLAMKIGGRFATPISLFICTISTLLTPTAAYWGWEWVLALRLINGLGATSILPMVFYLIEHWMPYDELSLGITCAQIFTAILTAASPLACGYLSAVHWSYAFYVPGILVLVLCAVWLLLVTDRPDENFLISQKELDLICGCSKSVQTSDCKSDNANQTSGADEQSEIQATWLDVLKTREFYVYAFIWTFHCSTYNIFSFILPNYLRQFLKLDAAENGTYCFLIQSGVLLAVIWPHPILRLLQVGFKLSLTMSRAILFTFTSSMIALTWVYVGFFHSDQLILLFINRCFQNSSDLMVTGSMMSNFAKAGISGLVFSMVNTIGNISTVVASPMVGYFLDYTGQSAAGWSWIYHGIGSVQILMLIVFIIFVNSEPVQFKKNKEIGQTSDKTGIDDATQVVVIDKKGTRNIFDKSKPIESRDSNKQAHCQHNLSETKT